MLRRLSYKPPLILNLAVTCVRRHHVHHRHHRRAMHYRRRRETRRRCYALLLCGLRWGAPHRHWLHHRALLPHVNHRRRGLPTHRRRVRMHDLPHNHRRRDSYHHRH